MTATKRNIGLFTCVVLAWLTEDVFSSVTSQLSIKSEQWKQIHSNIDSLNQALLLSGGSRVRLHPSSSNATGTELPYGLNITDNVEEFPLSARLLHTFGDIEDEDLNEIVDSSEPDYETGDEESSASLSPGEISGEPVVAPLKVLFLSSDTGGGHRASAESLGKQFQKLVPGSSYELLDVWSEAGVYPYNTLVESYKRLSNSPNRWRFLYHWSNNRLVIPLYDLHSSWACEKRIRDKIASYKPDVVVSVHPGMNYTPLRSVRHLNQEEKLVGDKSIPFFTVVTDYGAGHSAWFQKEVDKIYIASEPLRKIALNRKRVPSDKISMVGLPIRAEFDVQAQALGDRTTESGRAYQLETRKQLDLVPEVDDAKVILVMGGGEGVGSLQTIVEKLYLDFTQNGVNATIVVVCGRNDKLRDELQTRDWENFTSMSRRVKLKKNIESTLSNAVVPSRLIRRKFKRAFVTERQEQLSIESRPVRQGKVKVLGLGFVRNMADYMVASDVLVTKAGPGTIAEAAALGLPIMLTSYLPGQEAGNVDLVVNNEFGAFQRNPKHMAATLRSWLLNDHVLRQMSLNAQKEGRPHAAFDIVQDIVQTTQQKKQPKMPLAT